MVFYNRHGSNMTEALLKASSITTRIKRLKNRDIWWDMERAH